MDGARNPEWLRRDLSAVAAALGSFDLRLVGPDAEAERASLRESILRHLLPRVGDPHSPLVVAIVGPAGGGKSSLFNSLAESRLAPTGAVRPGTRYPVFWSDGPLPDGLERLRASLGGVVLQGDRRTPENMVIVDTPPPDVDGPVGERPADAVLDAADACLFVASALRYADAAGWDLLDTAARRGLATVFVLNKLSTDPGAARAVVEDMARRLAGRGLIPRPAAEMIIGIPFAPILRAIGGPAPVEVAALRKELEAIADPQSRLSVGREVAARGLAEAAARLESVSGAAAEERRLRIGLSGIVAEAYRNEAASLRRGTLSGSLADLRGDAERLVADLTVIATLRAGRAARAATDAWSLHPAGAALVEAHPGLWMHGDQTVTAARLAARGWVGSLPGIVADHRSRRWLRRRRPSSRLVELVQRAAVERDWVPERRDLRRLSGLDGAVVAARRGLADRLESVLDTDAVRFTDVLGPDIPQAVIGRLGPEEADGVR
jgi:hypothetical protein